jgi:hypothetical protein
MDLESLANELLLDLFEYLSGVDLLRTFYDLNTRFNDLIYLHFQTNMLNFQSISKCDFDFVCQKYLSSITNQIRSLRLSDDDDTPQQIDLFFSYHFSLQQFSYLQSLSIYRIYSFHSLERILDELPSLVHLRHLKLTRYNLVFNELYDIGIIDRIERLSNLLSCHLDITNTDDRCILIPSIISLSLKDLSIPHLSCNINQLLNFIKYISNLQSLYIRIVDHSTLSQISSMNFLTIKKLNILFYGSCNSIKNLLQTMTNLQELKINMPSTYIDGHYWQTLIETNLSNLILFQFKMSTSIFHQKNKEEKIDEILNSFRSHFWIHKHQWFVQCHWVNADASSVVYVYTLPYAFHNFLYIGNGQLKSTCIDEHQNWSFDRIHNLHYSYVPTYQNSSFSYVHLENIQYLDLTIPFDDSFWLIVPTLDRLKSLNIVLNSEMYSNDMQSKLQSLIDRSSNLRSLTYFSWSNQNIFPFEIKNSSIRQLDLRSPNLVYDYLHCIELSRSSIGQQCQVLLINVEQRTNIMYLINHMNNLRALIVECPKTLQTSKKDENLIEWLQQNLPPTCVILNTNKTDDNIRLWIR